MFLSRFSYTGHLPTVDTPPAPDPLILRVDALYLKTQRIKPCYQGLMRCISTRTSVFLFFAADPMCMCQWSDFSTLMTMHYVKTSTCTCMTYVFVHMYRYVYIYLWISLVSHENWSTGIVETQSLSELALQFPQFPSYATSRAFYPQQSRRRQGKFDLDFLASACHKMCTRMSCCWRKGSTSS